MIYSFADSERWALEWIRSCLRCIDKNSNFMATKKCIECIRNPYAACGDGKIDWYNEDQKSRVQKQQDFNEKKKQKFLEEQAKRNNNGQQK